MASIETGRLVIWVSSLQVRNWPIIELGYAITAVHTKPGIVDTGHGPETDCLGTVYGL